MTTNKIRFQEVDILKGMAILFVMLGHSFCEYPIDLHSSINPGFQHFVVYCQMPVFFLASGFLFSLKDSWLDFFSKKSKRIIIPYIAFGVAAQVLRVLSSGFSHSGESPSLIDAVVKILTGQSYWFLYSLILMMIAARIFKGKWSRLALCSIAIASVLFTSVGTYTMFTIGKTAIFCVWFFLGLYLRDIYAVIAPFAKKYRYPILAVFMCAYVATCVIPHVNNTPLLRCYLAPLLGCAAIWMFSIVTSSEPAVMSVIGGGKLLIINALKHLGKYSLQYYLNHLLIMLGCYMAVSKLPITNSYLQLFLIFALAVFLSWVMLKVEILLSKLPYVRQLFGL